MGETPTARDFWGRRALAYTRGLLEAAPLRGSTTPGERQAAEHIVAQLAELGVTDVQAQPFQAGRSLWLFLGLAFGLAMLGHGSYFLLSRPLGWEAALAVSSLAFAASWVLLVRKFTFRPSPFDNALPRGPSQNVIAALSPSQEARRDVVLVAHLDTQRAVWWFATESLARLYAWFAPVGMYGVVAAPVIYLLAEILRVPALQSLGLLLAGLHLVAWFTGVTADLGLYTPGANDNGSAIGTTLALVERLQAEPLDHTRVWLLFSGCEETGCDGMQAFLREYGPRLRDAIFLDFELVGVGEQLVFLETEGLIRRRRIPPQVETILKAVGEDFDLAPVSGGAFGVFTEMGTLWERGFLGVCLMCMPPDLRTLPFWHRLDDGLGNLNAGSLGRAHALAWALLRAEDGRPSVRVGDEELRSRS